MAVFAEGTPCWVDVALDDLEAGKRFYGSLFGWTFADAGTATQSAFVNALSDGLKVAALAPKRDGRMPTAWGVYFATDDIVALAAKVRAAGGQLLTDPVAVEPLGVMAVAADPGGGVFGLWQAGTHSGFEKRDEPGSFCWTEVYTHDKELIDPFYETVFGFEGRSRSEEHARSEELAQDEELARSEGDAQSEERAQGDAGVDFRTWSLAGTEPGPETAIGGRSVMSDAFPVEMPDHFLVYFVVESCDGAVEATKRLGGRVQLPPVDTPFGRIAVLVDNQGATFAVLAEPEKTLDGSEKT
ncbi:VOC family protein [Streptomyces sp. 21So2-11]|uniref:VOC family protein n=1 Tax=Streptomyces sp. 21So2-11 TaxID=3144408 RepID=UPI00321AF3BE